MELYHGSYCEISNPNISYSRDSLDFGRGFYLTDIKKQATEWVDRFIRRGKPGCINIYTINLDELKIKYKIKEFHSYNMEWLDYFYKSNTYDLIKNGVSDIHCRGYKYLADELMLEYGFKYHKGYVN